MTCQQLRDLRVSLSCGDVQRGTAVAIGRVCIDAAQQHQLGMLRPTLRRGSAQLRRRLLCRPGQPGTGSEQELRHAQTVSPHRAGERRGAMLVARIRVAATSEQLLHNGDMAGGRGRVQRVCTSVVRLVAPQAGVEQRPGAGEVARGGGKHEIARSLLDLDRPLMHALNLAEHGMPRVAYPLECSLPHPLEGGGKVRQRGKEVSL